jgi:uncharacterized membrane protein (UPF0127 family)
MRARLRYKGKEVTVEDIKRVSPIGKYAGLMFKPKETQALLFEFKKGRNSIHSFFCKPFLAIWLLEGRIVDFRIVKPNLPSIKPREDFDKLIEIPFNNKYSHVIGFFIDGGKV